MAISPNGFGPFTPVTKPITQIVRGDLIYDGPRSCRLVWAVHRDIHPVYHLLLDDYTVISGGAGETLRVIPDFFAT